MIDDRTVTRPGLVSSVIVLDRGRFLLVQEGKEWARGLWGLPGGRVDPGESFLDAAHRELLEETGLEVRPLGMTRVMRYTSQTGAHVLRVNLVGDLAGGELRVDGAEILDAKWISADEFLALPDNDIRTPHAARVAVQDMIAGRVFSLDILWDDFLRSE